MVPLEMLKWDGLVSSLNSIENSFPKKLLAVHINHMIRGSEADRDEAFSKDFCEKLGVEFISKKIDVPSLSKELSIGMEEAARKARYSHFADIISSRNDISTIAVAHNSTDNIETVLFNLIRGAGINGVSGIKPVRENLVRPLIYSAKADILLALDTAKIPYVVDSTNQKIDYTRNYIRHNIIPHFASVSENFEKNIQRTCRNLRSDNDYIESEAERVFSESATEKGIELKALRALHPALLTRVLFLMAKKSNVLSLESTHVKKVCELISEDKERDFSVSIPGNLSFISSQGYLRIAILEEESKESFCVSLKLGINRLPNSDTLILLSEEKFDKTFLNVHKISIQQRIDFDIINGSIFAREKRDGDSYKYGGMTHKLKKIFNDKGIPPSQRNKIPIICDSEGILWVPGFPVRDGVGKKSEKSLYIALSNETI